MEVRGLGSIGASAPIGRTAPSSASEVEISSLGRMLDDASRTPGVREQRLAQIKAAIEAGTYETPEKLQLALDRMLDQIGRDNS
jgi:negative regulator of flagellin synthesis FlgM